MLKIIKIILWPLIMLMNILDGNYWAEKIDKNKANELGIIVRRIYFVYLILIL